MSTEIKLQPAFHARFDAGESKYQALVHRVEVADGPLHWWGIVKESYGGCQTESAESFELDGHYYSGSGMCVAMEGAVAKCERTIAALIRSKA